MGITDTLLSAGTVGAVAFVVTFLADGATRPGYRPRYHAVSALSLGGRGWIQKTNFVVCGGLVTAAALGVLRADANPLLALAIAVFGVGLLLSGAFPMDPMRAYPPGTPASTPTTTSRRHRRHDGAGVVVFCSLPGAAAVAAATLPATGWAVYAAITAVASTVTFGLFGAAWEQDHALTGLVQRVAIVIGWVWLAATCWHLTTW